MRLPRFRLRTLMIAVAVVAFQFALLTRFPGPFVTILPFGPLLGIVWASRRRREHRYTSLRGGVWGGVVQAVPLLLLIPGYGVYERVSGISRVGNEWFRIAFELWFVPLTSLLAGVAIGLAA